MCARVNVVPLDLRLSAALTTERLGYTPHHKGLLQDMVEGTYFKDVQPDVYKNN
jgi:hypothetical protein